MKRHEALNIIRGVLSGGYDYPEHTILDKLEQAGVITLETSTFVDPPSGHRYGFPRILPEGKTLLDLLKESGYPEKDYALAFKYSRYWNE